MPLRALTILFLAACSSAHASLPLEASLRDLACGADHVLVGRVVAVDMRNSRGRPVRNEEARTGPGLKNTIRLEVEVLEVIESTEAIFPSSVWVPLDPFMHFSLGQIKAAHAEPSDATLVFLRGQQFEPIIAGRFFWHLNSREEALAFRKECRP
jgi:hypothetical protein